MKKVILLSVIITVLEIIAALFLLPMLPEQIPMHWNINGDVDSYGAWWMIFLAPAVTVVVDGLIVVLQRIDPKRHNAERSEKAYSAVILLYSLLFMLLFVITALVSVGIPVSVNRILPPAIGALLIGMGNYLPKLKQNYFLGIRMPWTLASDIVWTKTHRLGGWLFMADGLLFVIAAFLPPPINFILPLGGFIAISLIIALYAYMVFCKQPKDCA